MDNEAILNNSTDISLDRTMEDMLLYNRMGLEIDGLSKVESEAVDRQMIIDTDNDLYEVIKIKNEIITTLKDTNYNLTNLLFNFDDKINKIDVTVNNSLSNISTRKDIHTVMQNNKKLANQVNIERENIRKLTDKLFKTTNELDIVKHTYNSLNNIYINNFQTNSIDMYKLDKLQEEIDTIKKSKDDLVQLKANLTCKICYENYINCLIEPCGHMSTCLTCINHIKDTSTDDEIKCPMCNGLILNCKNIYLPV